MPDLHIGIDAVDLAGRRVLRDVHTTVSSGTFAAVLGPNGAGKTTLLRTVLGLIPFSGSVRLGELAGPALRRATGYVPQKHEVAWDYPISVRDCVLSGRTDLVGWFRRPSISDLSAVDAALDLADIAHLARRPIGQLSGGQKQRVLVARALARKPRLLILDEPFTGVDAPTEERLMDLFAELAAGGTTILMSSHNLPAAVARCDQLLLINGTLNDSDAWQPTFGVSPQFMGVA